MLLDEGVPRRPACAVAISPLSKLQDKTKNPEGGSLFFTERIRNSQNLYESGSIFFSNLNQMNRIKLKSGFDECLAERPSNYTGMERQVLPLRLAILANTYAVRGAYAKHIDVGNISRHLPTSS